MGNKQQAQANAAWAKDMKERGIFHGKRMTTTHAPAIPVDQPGSAAYRRMTNKKK